MNERVKDIRAALGLTMEEFGGQIGVARSTIANIESGRKNLTQRMANDICREFHVNPEYLSRESEEMFLEMSKEDEISAFLGDILREKDESFKKRFVSTLAALNDHDWAVMEKIIDRITEEKD